jgi:hypothetical protein
MKVSIYRVEQPRGGFGPYAAEFEAVLGGMFAEHRRGSHPGPVQDELLGWIDPAEHCGFATLEHLHEWFDGYHNALHDAGFIIARYSVPLPLVRYGKTQAVFRRGDLWPEASQPMH